LVRDIIYVWSPEISLSLLETGEREFRFLFLLSKWEKLFSNFSFSSRIDFFASRQPLVWWFEDFLTSFCNIVLDEVPKKKEDRISTVVICNARAETHNRKFGIAVVAGQLDCLAPTFETSCLSNPLNLPLLLPFSSFSIVDRNIAMHHGKLQELQVTRYDFCEG